MVRPFSPLSLHRGCPPGKPSVCVSCVPKENKSEVTDPFFDTLFVQLLPLTWPLIVEMKVENLSKMGRVGETICLRPQTPPPWE